MLLLLLGGGGVCTLWCHIFRLKSHGSEDKQKQADRALRPLTACWALSLQRCTAEMGQELNDENPCSTSLKDRRKPRAISRMLHWLRVSEGTRETQHPRPRGIEKNPRAQKTH